MRRVLATHCGLSCNGRTDVHSRRSSRLTTRFEISPPHYVIHATLASSLTMVNVRLESAAPNGFNKVYS